MSFQIESTKPLPGAGVYPTPPNSPENLRDSSLTKQSDKTVTSKLTSILKKTSVVDRKDLSNIPEEARALLRQRSVTFANGDELVQLRKIPKITPSIVDLNKVPGIAPPPDETLRSPEVIQPISSPYETVNKLILEETPFRQSEEVNSKPLIPRIPSKKHSWTLKNVGGIGAIIAVALIVLAGIVAAIHFSGRGEGGLLSHQVSMMGRTVTVGALSSTLFFVVGFVGLGSIILTQQLREQIRKEEFKVNKID